MKIHKPKVTPEFYTEPFRVLYVVRCVDGSLCNVEDAEEAIALLAKECTEYLKFMKKFC